MSSITDQSLQRATASTFEELVLLFPDPELTDEQSAEPVDAAVAVEFRGPLTGRLVLRVSSSLLPMIAANMLGEDQAQEPPLQRDALGEVANVVCGNLLPAVAGGEAVFKLSAPAHLSEEAHISRDVDAPAARAEFGIETGRAVALLYLFLPSESDVAMAGATAVA